MVTAGWKGKIEVSSDGINYYEVSQVQSGSFDPSIEEEDITTWDDQGSTNNFITRSGFSVTLDGLYSPNDQGQKIVFYVGVFNRNFIYVKFWTDRDFPERYFKFEANASNTGELPTSESQKFSATINSKGLIDPVGYPF